MIDVTRIHPGGLVARLPLKSELMTGRSSKQAAKGTTYQRVKESRKLRQLRLVF